MALSAEQLAKATRDYAHACAAGRACNLRTGGAPNGFGLAADAAAEAAFTARTPRNDGPSGMA